MGRYGQQVWCNNQRPAEVIVGIFCKRGGDHLSFGILPQGSRSPPPPHLPREPQGPRSPLPPPPQGTKVPPCSARSPHPHLEVASFFVTGNIQPRSAVGTGTPWASGQQVHEPRRSCELPVRKKRNQICQLLTSGSLPALSMFQSSWGTSAANVCVPWPGDIARMSDAQAWFEIASGY